MVRYLVIALAALWSSLAFGQTVPGRFPPGTVYGNPGATEANPRTVQTFATSWTTATRPASPTTGQTGFNTTLQRMEIWNGTIWDEVGGSFVVNIADYGACSGGNLSDTPSVDDSAAINTAINVIRSRGFGKLTGPSGCRSYITSSLNFTDLSPSAFVTGSPVLSPAPGYSGIIIDLSDVQIWCKVANGICIDAINSRQITWFLNLYGDDQVAGNEPSIGFQFGSPCWNKTGNNCPGNAFPQIIAGQHAFYNNQIRGKFKKAAKINWSSEGSGEFKGYYSNNHDTADTNPGMGYVVDCINHWGKTSAFTTINQVADGPGTDVNVRCGGPDMYNTVIQTLNGTALWIAGTYGILFDHASYASTATSSTTAPATIYGNTATANGGLKLYGHFENTNAAVAVLFTGPIASYTIEGYNRYEPATQSKFADMGLDFAAGVTSIRFTGFSVEMTSVVTNGTFTIFGNYNKLNTAVTATNGTCADGAKTFAVIGGMGIAASVTGTVTGGVLGTLTVASGGTYQATPGTPITLTGGAGCSVNPTATATYASTPPPISGVDARIWAGSQAYIGVLPSNFAGMICAVGGCNFVPGQRYDGGQVTPTAQAFTQLRGTGSGTLDFINNAVSLGSLTNIAAGGRWNFPWVNLGTAGSAVGTLTFANTTSGTITVQPQTGALSGTLTVPARTATIATTTGSLTNNNCADFDVNGNIVDSGMPCVGKWTTATRPGSPVQGQFGFNTDTDANEFWNGLTTVSSATIATGGSGCTGTVIMTGTTGTGSKFIASATATAGAVSGAVSFTSPTGQVSPGSYTVNPTLVGEATTTAGGCTGTQPTLNLTMANVWHAQDNSIVNVLDFGCIGNDQTRDESVCINNAIAYAHSLGAFGGIGHGASVRIYFPPRIFWLDHPINMTGWSQTAPVLNSRGPAVTLDGYGAYLWAKNSFDAGKPILDMLGSSSVRIQGLSFYGNNATTPPSVGIQMGRPFAAATTAQANSLHDVSMHGAYSVAALYNTASEMMDSFRGIYSNSFANAYGVALDGNFHLGASINSNFLTITRSVDSHASSLHMSFYGGEIDSIGSPATAAVFMSGDIEAPLFDQVYWLSTGPACAQVDFSNSGTNRFNNGRFNIHCEAASVANVFLFTGALSVPTVYNFEYKDPVAFSTQSIFKIGSGGITGINLYGLDVRIASFATPAATIFDDPTKYNASGTVAVPAAGNWNVPNSWYGCVTIAATRSCTDPSFAVSTGSLMPLGLQSAIIAISGTGGSYAPGDRLSFALGTRTVAAILAVSRTQARSATVASGGTTCTNGPATMTGTTGAGTKFTATGTVTGGVLSGTITITAGGNYSVNPTVLTSEPVTGVPGCAVQPSLNITMGALAAWPVNPGNYSIPPNTATIAQTSSTGAGTGATWTPTWSFVAALPLDPDLSANSSVNTNYGNFTGAALTTGSGETFVGSAAGLSTTSGSNNTGIGINALRVNTTGANNSCLGAFSCSANIGGGALAALGMNALVLATGGLNTAVGQNAGNKITSGTSNLVLGQGVASTTLATGLQNILLGTANNCDTTANNTSNQFKVCAASGSTDLMVGDMTAASLWLGTSGSFQVGSPTKFTLSTGELGIAKITASGTAPGAGSCKISAVAGTTGGTCKLIAICGTTTTAVTIVDNVGGGC